MLQGLAGLHALFLVVWDISERLCLKLSDGTVLCLWAGVAETGQKLLKCRH